MRVCLVGAGMMGSTLARLWARAGHEVVLTSRHPDRVEALAEKLGGRVAPITQAVQDADAVLLAVPLGAVPQLAAQVGPQLAGRVVIDCCNPFPRRDGPAADAALNTIGGSGTWTALQLPQARVVKAFNSVLHRTLSAAAHRPPPRVAIPVAGDCAKAVGIVEQLVDDAGFEPVVVGGLERSVDFDPTSSLWNTGWDAERVRAALRAARPGRALSSRG